MSYEMFRANIAYDLSGTFDQETIEKIIGRIDAVAEKYDIKLRSTDIIVADTTNQDVLEYYIATKSLQHITTGTLKNYYSVLSKFFAFVRKPLKDISAVDIRKFLGMYKLENRIQDSTLNSKRSILHNFFVWICDEGILTTGNPCAHVLPIKYADNTRDPMNRDELELMRESCRDEREKALVEFLYSTGLRISEVAALTLSDVDFEKRTVLVRHGKGDKKRTSYINSRALIALKKYLLSRTDTCEYLFVDKRTGAKHGLQKRALEDEVKRIWMRTGLSHKITPHVFRNTTGTLSAQAGMPVEQVQKLLGHASIKTTMRYVKVFDDEVKTGHQKYTA